MGFSYNTDTTELRDVNCLKITYKLSIGHLEILDI